MLDAQKTSAFIHWLFPLDGELGPRPNAWMGVTSLAFLSASYALTHLLLQGVESHKNIALSSVPQSSFLCGNCFWSQNNTPQLLGSCRTSNTENTANGSLIALVPSAAQMGIKSINTVEAKIADCIQSGMLLFFFLSRTVNFLRRKSNCVLFYPTLNKRVKIAYFQHRKYDIYL